MLQNVINFKFPDHAVTPRSLPPSLPPQAVCQSASAGVCQDGISMAVVQQSPEAVVSELFSSVCAEIRDEVIFSCVL